MSESFIILGIETSCDDTAVALVRIYHESQGIERGEILSSEIFDQYAVHSPFGGVVPELAARAHLEKLDACLERALENANIPFEDVDKIAVTSGPGLIGGLISGILFAKGLSKESGKPLIGVNHLAGHALTPRLTNNLDFPYLMLLASGGHCQYLVVSGPTTFTRLGGTIDDAPGEAFDKTAKILGLKYPGGPEIEKYAHFGNKDYYSFPKPLLNKKDCNLSFSGLKTAIRREYETIINDSGTITNVQKYNLCSSFQDTIATILAQKSHNAMKEFVRLWRPRTKNIAISGGVAANKQICSKLKSAALDQSFGFISPSIRLCTDNGAIIAYAGAEKFLASSNYDSDLIPRPRWPLDPFAKPMLGSGKKGTKV